MKFKDLLKLINITKKVSERSTRKIYIKEPKLVKTAPKNAFQY